MRWALLSGWIGLLAVAACATPDAVPTPHGGSARSARASEELLFAALPRAARVSDDARFFGGLHMAQPEARSRATDFAPPHRLRPCCAFGQGLAVSIATLPLPGIRIDNVLDPRQLGRHRYDAALIGLANGLAHAFLSPERNGLVYTRRGGFVDLAHVRGYADWTVYLTHRIGAMLATGGSIGLPDEGGRRVLHLTATPRDILRRVGHRRVARALAELVAWQLSLWHETATWYGWSSVAVFPERVSAFSPEDLYSNALGIRVASALLRIGGAETRRQYEANMDAVLPQVLERLGAVSAECSRRAAQLVDHIWWDSRRRLPRPDVVLERNFQTGPELVPWRVSLPESGHGLGGNLHVGPMVLRVPDRLDVTETGSLVRLVIQPEQGRARRVLGDRVNGRDLEAVVRRIREEAQRSDGG